MNKNTFRKHLGNSKTIFFTIAGIVLLTVIVYWRVHKYDFVFDDRQYVIVNQNIQTGLTATGIRWALTATYSANWHPLTWLSLMLDYDLYGLNAGGFHITNLIFHLFNTVLLFWLFLRMTKLLWPSAFVAALFALHPLHIESVAWIAERKDVLSTFFWFLTMLAYVRYTESKTTLRYVTVIILFALGLMAKPMLVTLPFVLLLMDYWPLNRLSKNAVLEKLPLFALSACSSVVTFFAQKSGGTVADTQVFSIPSRLENSIVSYTQYLSKTFWPAHLAVLYPHPENSLTIHQIVFAAIVLIFITILVIRFRHFKWLTFGWLWYLGTLVPVIGLIQVGDQAMADRYTYIPLVGIFIMIARSGYELFPRLRYRNPILALSATAILFALAARTYSQLGYWHDDFRLYEHTLRVTKKNAVIHYNMGCLLSEKGDTKEAIEQFFRCIEIDPLYTKAYYNLGCIYYKQGDIEKAVKYYSEAIRVSPDYAEAHNNFAALLLKKERFDEAIEHLRQVIKLDPLDAGAYNNLGIAFKQKKNFEEAIKCLKEAIKIKPNYADPYFLMAETFKEQGKITEAIENYIKALSINDNDADTHRELGKLLAKERKVNQAIAHFNRAIQLNPNLAGARIQYDKLLAIVRGARSYYTQAGNFQKQGNFVEAVKNYRQALDLVNDSPTTLNNLAWLLATNSKVRNPAEAVSLAEDAAKLTNYNQPEILDTLAAAYAANNDFAKAVETAQKAVDLAKSSNKQQLAEKISARLELYKKGIAYAEPVE